MVAVCAHDMVLFRTIRMECQWRPTQPTFACFNVLLIC